MKEPNFFKKYATGFILGIFSFAIALLAILPSVLPSDQADYLPSFEPITENSAAAGQLACTSWSSANINGCNWDMFKTNPKNPKCIVNSRDITLNLNSPGATTVKWKEIPSHIYCTDPSVTKTISSWASIPYSKLANIKIPSTKAGDKKICLQFSAPNKTASPVCGGIIAYKPTAAIDPAEVPSGLQSSTFRSCSKQPKQGKEINIATYNLGRFSEYVPGSMKATSEFVKTNGVDILVIQEISTVPTFSFVNELRAELKKQSNKDWYYHYQPHSDSEPNNSYGQMIVSKYPITDTEKNLYDGKSGGDRYFMRYKVKTPYGDLQVFNVHTRAEQEACAGVKQAAQFIKDEVGSSNTYAVVGGDFNIGWDAIEGKNSGGCNLPSENRIFTRSCISGASSCGYDKIDHLFRPKSSNLKFAELCRQNNFVLNGVGASLDHHPVLATIKFD